MTKQTSIDAYKTIDLPEMERKVLDAIETFGVDGCITDDLLAYFGDMSPTTLTPRYAPLVRKGLIVTGFDTRTGNSGRQQGVYRHSRFLDFVPMKDEPTKKKHSKYVMGIIDATRIVMDEPDIATARKKLIALLKEKIK